MKLEGTELVEALEKDFLLHPNSTKLFVDGRTYRLLIDYARDAAYSMMETQFAKKILDVEIDYSLNNTWRFES